MSRYRMTHPRFWQLGGMPDYARLIRLQRKASVIVERWAVAEAKKIVRNARRAPKNDLQGYVDAITHAWTTLDELVKWGSTSAVPYYHLVDSAVDKLCDFLVSAEAKGLITLNVRRTQKHNDPQSIDGLSGT